MVLSKTFWALIPGSQIQMSPAVQQASLMREVPVELWPLVPPVQGRLPMISRQKHSLDFAREARSPDFYVESHDH